MTDGLEQKWEGFVWCNPPYGPELGKWLGKLADHGNGIAIAFARTETKAFQAHVWPKADCLHFLFGRPHFYRPDGTRAKGNSGGPVVLIGYGETALERIWEAGMRTQRIPGRYVKL